MSLAAVQTAKPKRSDPLAAPVRPEHAEPSLAEVAGLPRYLAIQPKLMVGASDDPFEKEAIPGAGRNMAIQRAAAERGGETGSQGAPRDASQPGPATQAALTHVKGGAALPDGVRNSMEAALGGKLRRVRIHTDAPAARAAQELDARAFAFGQDIFFGEGNYQPDTAQGRRLLAHELVHTLQQPLDPSARAARVLPPDHSAERDADAGAEAIDSGRLARVTHVSPIAALARQPKTPPSMLQIGADLDSNDPTVRGSALQQLAHRVDEEAWRALLLAQDGRHADVRTESEQIIRSRFAAEPHFAEYVRAIAGSPKGALSDLAIRALARTGAGAAVSLENYRSVIHQRLTLARMYLGELDDTLYQLVVAATKAQVARDPMPTTAIDQLEIEVDVLPVEDLWEVGLRASTLLDQIAPVRQAVHQLLPAAAQFGGDGGMRRLIQSQLLRLLIEARKLTGEQDDPAYAEISKALGSFPATFAKAIVEQLHAHFTDALGQLRKQLTPERLESWGDAAKKDWQIVLKEVVQPVDADLVLMIRELDVLRPSVHDYPDAVFARLDALQPILQSIGERAQYLQHAGSMLDLYSDLKATNAWFGDDPVTLYDKASAFVDDFASIAKYRDRDPDAAREDYERLVSGPRYAELMEDVEDWKETLEKQASNAAFFGAILNLFIIIISIETGGLAGGFVRGVFGVGATTAGRLAIGALAFGADVEAFTATSRFLHWATSGSAGERSFGGELFENALMFGWLKGTGKVYERFVRGFEGVSPVVKAIGGATATFTAFQLWAVGLERRETGKWITPLDRRFWQVAGENALFLAAIHLGRPLVQPLFAPAQSIVTKFSVSRHNARCRELGARMNAWESAELPDFKEAVSITRRTQALYMERLDVLRAINRENPRELTDTELGAAESVLRAQVQATENALFQAEFRLVKHESLSDTFYYDGDPATLRAQYERQGYEFVEVDDATGRMRLRAPDLKVVDLLRTQLAPTGGGRGPQSAVAEAQYEQIRKMTTDVPAIAGNTGIPGFVLRTVKAHLFVVPHKIPVGPGEVVKMNFRADPRMAQLWLGASEGALSDADLVVFRRMLAHEYVEAVLMRKGYPFRSPRAGAWRADTPGEPVSRPTHEVLGAHDLAPLADADLPPFAHWRPMLGIIPTAAEARRRGVPIEGWMGIEPDPDLLPTAFGGRSEGDWPEFWTDDIESLPPPALHIEAKRGNLRITNPEFVQTIVHPRGAWKWSLYDEVSGVKVCETYVATTGNPAEPLEWENWLHSKQALLPSGERVQLDAAGFRWSDAAWDGAMNGYYEIYGSAPPSASGNLAATNLAIFQKNFVKVRAEHPGWSNQQIANEAVKPTPFGKTRLERGYGDMRVEASDYGNATVLGTELSDVPRTVRVEALPTPRRP